MGETGRTENGEWARDTARGAGGVAARQGRTLVVLAGPTASGKSALALALARALGGTVINTDAMQCYRELRLITARPSPEDEALAPHRLYGVRAAAEPANAAWWRGAALEEMNNCGLPILCGGTGMYFSALINGIAQVPEPGAQARTEARALLAELGAPGLHARLDAETALRLKPNDSQRVARAYEVLLGTGQGLAAWQRQTTHRLEGWRVRMILLDPPREVLREAIAARFAAMLAAGAVEEVRNFLSLGLDASLPLMRAHGVPELGAYLRGEITLGEATARAVLATHQYTKRQMTWFKHQKLTGTPDMQIIQSRIAGFEQLSESFIGNLVNFINFPG
ncbi:tRNA (adenosine(37)-N6)-dimethylallyltransferase MiaA [Acidocella sp.]|uniref:tRNA (adenosine(37)-N6)-dimethylallyltransferase MiaA n=1 Tax=Acidocella sp. TaxID=50710 RepID=UPI00179D5D08|nr:tRNA (adenosine(37)-N6)-dimethylallyltransferase MiaA [Acidocella sp.]NNM56190.1 tRNA (adenosine(37)-N6)-dimethylallyltransferase MiaA [Acidocella sp.]